MNVTTIQTNFGSGELDPTLRGQKDLDAYRAGAKQCRNVQRRSTGGLERRPGTLDLASLAGKARLVPFEFSADQRYLVAFTAAHAYVFDLSGNLLTTINGAPWDATTMWQMTTSQLGDDMLITHTAFWMQLLQRQSATSFTLANFAFDVGVDGTKIYQPYYKFDAPEVTLTPSAATGTITLTAKDKNGNPAPVFSNAYVGLHLRIYDAEVKITGYTSSSVLSGSVDGTLVGQLDLDPYKTTKGSVVVDVTHVFHGLANGASVTFSGSNDCGSIPGNFFDGAHAITVKDEHNYKVTLSGVTYTYYSDTNGDGVLEAQTMTAARISEDGGGPNVKFDVTGTPTRQWLEPSFSSVMGYPGAVCFHEGRLWFAGSTSQPDGCWGSNALQYFRFDVGKGYDGDSVQVATGTEDVSRTKHLISNGELIVMNANGEAAFIVRDGEPITPSNARIKGQSTAGCSDVQPCVFDGAVIFTQENGLTVFELVYSPQEGGFVADPISTLASHLIRTPTSISATPGTSSRAEQFCFFSNSDGTLAVFHSQRRENVAGWVLWTLGGGASVDSVCCIGPYIFLAVTVRGIQRLYRVSTTTCLDGAVVQTSGVATVNWTLDARVRSRTVSLVSELGYHGDVAVPANGVITLDTPVKTLQAGDAYYPTVETLPPSVSLSSGPTDGKIKRVVRTITDFGDDSLAVMVNDCPIDTLTNLDDPAGAIRPVTSPYEMHHLGCERDPTIVFTQSAPLANWRILSVLQEVAL